MVLDMPWPLLGRPARRHKQALSEMQWPVIIPAALLNGSLFSYLALENTLLSCLPLLLAVRDGHLFSAYLMLPLITTSMGLLLFNWYPSQARKAAMDFVCLKV